jgi:ABC-type lipoprotein release transport system permease subunit
MRSSIRYLGNKKGSGFLDTFAVFLFVFIATLVAGIALFIFNSFNAEWQGIDSIDANSKTKTDGFNSSMNLVLDGGIVLWFAILWMGSLVSAIFLDNSPIFFVIFFLLAIVSFIVFAPFANIQSELSESALSAGYNHLPMSMFINNHLLLFIGAYIISIGVALYAKVRYGVGI